MVGFLLDFGGWSLIIERSFIDVFGSKILLVFVSLLNVNGLKVRLLFFLVLDRLFLNNFCLCLFFCTLLENLSHLSL